jgi:hypothetical protein
MCGTLEFRGLAHPTRLSLGKEVFMKYLPTINVRPQAVRDVSGKAVHDEGDNRST